MILASSRRISFYYYYYYRLRNLFTVFFFVSCDVLAFSRLFSVVLVYKAAGFYSFRVGESVVQKKIAECSKKALSCGDCCNGN